jgi:hypothetical protein
MTPVLPSPRINEPPLLSYENTGVAEEFCPNSSLPGTPGVAPTIIRYVAPSPVNTKEAAASAPATIFTCDPAAALLAIALIRVVPSLAGITDTGD